MSWSIKVFVKKEDAVPVIRQWVPQAEIADFLVAQVGRIPDVTPATSCPWDAAMFVRIEGHGHGGNIGKLEIEGFNFAVPPFPPSPPMNNEHVAPGAEKFSG